LGSETRVFVDVTALFALARSTGIQRVVRTIIGDPPALDLVAFDPALGGYRLVSQLPQATERADSHLRRHSRGVLRFLSYLLWLFLGLLLAPVANTSPFQRFKREAGRVYSRFFGEVTIHGDISGPPVSLEKLGYLWLLDIPKTPAHMAFLRNQVVESSVVFGVYVYDLIPVDSPELISAPDRLTLIRQYKEYLEIVSRANRVLCLSDYTLRRLTAYSKSRGFEFHSPPSVVYPPLVQSMESARQGPSKRQEGGFPKRILGLAPLNKRKNLQVVLRAVRRLLQSGVDADLILVVPILSAVHLPTALLAVWMTFRYPKKVKLTGPVSHETLVELHRWADVVVVPSRSEGFGLPIVEALSAGKPVVASACTSFVELARFLPIHLADPDSPSDWASALQAVDFDQDQDISFSSVLTDPEEFRKRLFPKSH